MDQIEELIGQAAIFEQLAEEAAELAAAASKYARILRNENPARETAKDVYLKVVEEYSDVVLCTRVLTLYPDQGIILNKMERWLAHILKKQADKG